MRRRWWLNAGLLMLVAVLAAFAWWAGFDPAGKTLLEGDAGGVSSVVIQRRDRENVRLRREDGNWWLEAPHRLPASDFHVEQLLKVAADRSLGNYDAGEMEPERLGLDPPRARLQLDHTEVLFGDSDAVDGLRYVSVGGRIHLVQNRVMPLLEGPWWNFIDRRIVPPHRRLQAVETEHYRLWLDPGGWSLAGTDAGNGPAIGADDMAEVWHQAAAMVVREVRREPDREQTLRFTFENGEERRFRHASEDGEYRLVDLDRGLAYVFDAASMTVLLEGREPPTQDPPIE